MKIAVIGANGFIGRHVLAELVRRSIEFIPVDINPPLEGVFSDLPWIKLDYHQPPEKTFDLLGRPDTCISLAWGDLMKYRSLHHFETELPGQYRFLSSLIRDGLTSLVVSGTCSEYGMQSGPLREDAATHPVHPYSFAKNALRLQLEFLREKTPFAFTWARLFYVFGEGQSSNSLWPQLKQAVMRGDPVFPMSGGKQLRDYLPIETVAENLVSLALAKADIGIVNICSGKPIAVRDLVEGWITKNNWKIKLDLGRYPYPDYEPMEFWGNDKKLRSFKTGESSIGISGEKP